MAVHVGQAEVAALITIGEPPVIDTKLVQDGGVQIMNVHGAGGPLVFIRLRLELIAVGIGDVVAVIIRAAVGDARLDATAGHPNTETARVMITPIVILAQPALTIRRAPKLATPHHERVIEHTALT